MVVNLSDELDIKLKTILEADESKSAAQIEKQLPSIAGKIKGKIKVQVEADADSAKSIQASVKAATSSVKGGSVVVPIKVKVDDQYLKRGLIQDFKRLKAQAGSLKLDTKAFENLFNAGDLKNAKSELGVLYKQLRAISAEGRASLPDLAVTNFSKNVKDAAAQTEKLKTQFKALSGGIPADVEGKITGLRTELERLAKVPVGEATEADIKSYKNLSVLLDEVKNTLTQLKAADKSFKLDIGAEKLQTDIKGLQQKLINLKVNWSKAFTKPEFAGAWQDLWDKAGSGAITTRAQLTALNSEFSVFTKRIEGAGLNTKTLFGTIKDGVQKFSQWFFIGNAVASSVRGIRQMVDSVKAVDIRMTELRKVTDETAATYNKFFTGASKRAVELATSLDKYIGSVADFSRMGFSIPDSENLADVATIYFNVADGISNMEDATSSVISTMKAFNIQADQSTKIIDIFNEVGKICCRR